MTYNETIDYLFNCAPLFQQVGSGAYKAGLDTTRLLDTHFGHPHRKFRTIHIAGTNGKGSCSHTIAAILQSAGYKVGLYTSPHLIDFRERIRVNGKTISKEYIVDFVEKEKRFFEPLAPSFFELTTALAFKYFAEQGVDVAVIEVGLGGRLDCTNIISPDACIITNISHDHTQFLGNTLEQIAAEKAGIIKPGTPVIIGETTSETEKVFTEKAQKENAPVFFAEQERPLTDATHTANGFKYNTTLYGTIEGELAGDYQIKNTNTILTAIPVLVNKGYKIDEQAIRKGFANVTSLTGLMGRWQTISRNPHVICDAGHNTGGIAHIVKQLAEREYKTLRIVFGMVNDKDISSVLAMLPKKAEYYFTQASVKRAMQHWELKKLAAKFNLHGHSYPSVSEALEAAKSDATPEDLIFVGGSCFIVADLLAAIHSGN